VRIRDDSNNGHSLSSRYGPTGHGFLAAELEDPRFQSGHMDFSPTGLSPDLLRTLPPDLAPSIGFLPLARPGLVTVLRIYHRFPLRQLSWLLSGYCRQFRSPDGAAALHIISTDRICWTASAPQPAYVRFDFCLLSGFGGISLQDKPRGTAPTRQRFTTDRVDWSLGFLLGPSTAPRLCFSS
jgi:hypothetical protein